MKQQKPYKTFYEWGDEMQVAWGKFITEFAKATRLDRLLMFLSKKLG